MDFFFEFILELLFEGTAAATKSKVAPRALKIVITVFIFSLMLLFFALAYIFRDHKEQRYVFIGIGLVIAIYLSGLLREGIRKMDRL